MLVDGKAIAADIYKEIKNELSHLDIVPHLTIFTCAPDLPTQKYLEVKKKHAHSLGLKVDVVEVSHASTTETFVQLIERASMQTDGIVVQLPLPKHLNTDTVIASIPTHLDVDVLNYAGSSNDVLPPVVGAIDEIARRHRVIFSIADIAVVGEGKLVGAPFLAWAHAHGWRAGVVTEVTPHPEEIYRTADILVLGTGVPGVIQPDMIKDGVIIFDAGTAMLGGKLVGDAAPECVEKAELMTPVPGGIGPITVAVLMRNLVLLSKKHAQL